MRSKTDVGSDVQNEPSPSAEEVKASSDAKSSAADKDYPGEANARSGKEKKERYSDPLNQGLSGDECVDIMFKDWLALPHMEEITNWRTYEGTRSISVGRDAHSL